MDFLNGNFDLSQTIFSDSDLSRARSYLSAWIQKEKPSWLKNPQGPFGRYWKENSPQAACHLIDLATMMERIINNITPESVPRFHKKVKENLLPHPSDIKQFYEALTELEVAYALLDYVSPLILEPSIPSQRRAPDMAFRLPEGKMYLDVTVFRGGPLEKWEDTKQHIREAIHRRVLKRKKALNIDIQIGLETIQADHIIKQVLDGINVSESGEVLVGNKGRIRWEPCPVIETNDIFSIPETSSFASAIHSPGGSVSTVVASQATLALPLPEDVERIQKLLFNALTNKLKEKQKQFPRNQPAFSVMKLGHRAVPKESVLQALRDSLWRKDDYRWMSGIILFTPKQGFSPTDSPANLTLSANPRAKCPVSDSMWSLFKEATQFHYS